MEFPTSDVNGAKVTYFICTPLTALARSKTRAFVIFPALGATGAALLLNVMTFSFFARVFGLGALSAGSLHTAKCRTLTWNNV
jgi:hypothetical protein